MELKQFDLEDIKSLREARMKELRIPLVVDLLEQAVKKGTCWGLNRRDETICYWINLEEAFAPLYENSIIELYVKMGYRTLIDEIFHLITKQSKTNRIYLRTDETFLISFLLEKGYNFEVVGPLLLREKKVDAEHQENLEFKPISEKTLDEAFKILLNEEPDNAGVKEDDYPRIKSEIGKDSYWTLIREGIVTGVAFWTKQKNSNYTTIFPVVHRKYRKQDYGFYMISKLADYLESKGYQPVSYMNQFNIPARKAFEKSGFYVAALHTLLRLTP
ncbi:MAG: GNAT family N-acetyltransferase [Candidatus Freyarchaeum deiterrae]